MQRAKQASQRESVLDANVMQGLASADGSETGDKPLLWHMH